MNHDQAFDSIESSFRESLLEHLFVTEILKEAWLNQSTVDVLHSEVDSFGYDLVLGYRGVIRHIQLKGSRADARTSRQSVNIKLAEKPSGCVVWLLYQEDIDRRIINLNYLVFGNGPGEPLPSLEEYRTAKHTKGDASGIKSERPNIRVIPKGSFRRIQNTTALMEWLFEHSPRKPNGLTG